MFDLANRASAGASGARRREIRFRDAMGKEIERRRRTVSFVRKETVAYAFGLLPNANESFWDGLAYWAETWEWAEYQ